MSHIDEHGQYQEPDSPKKRSYPTRAVLWLAVAMFVPYAVIWWTR